MARLIWGSLRSRLLSATLLLLAVSIGAMGFWLNSEMRESYVQEAKDSLLRQAMLAELAANGRFAESNLDSLARLMGTSSGTRATLIRPDGLVLGETERDASTLENHLDRPEVQKALAGAPGIDIRQSRTTGAQMLYIAVPSYDAGGGVGGIVRLSLDLTSLNANLSRIGWMTAAGAALAIIIGGILAVVLARQISLPLEKMSAAAHSLAGGDFSVEVPAAGPGEIVTLARSLQSMSSDLNTQFASVQLAAERLYAVLNSMRDGVLLIDAADRIEMVNPAAEEMLGIGGSKLVGEKSNILSRYPELFKLHAEVRQGGESQTGRVGLGGRAGSRQIRAAVLRLESGRILMTLQDLSDVYRSLDIRRDFVANVSHEFRTPLTALSLIIGNLQAGALDDRRLSEEFLQNASAEVERLSHMTRELLQLSRLESGAEELIRRPFSAEELISDISQEMSAILATTSHHMQTEGDLSITISADFGKLRQVLINYLDNAIKFSPPGSLILIGVKSSVEEVHLYVRDFGQGVPPEHIPRVFERFFKGRQGRGGGTGLGLAIVRHIAEAHGGSAYVQSKVGEGATFGIAIPRDLP